MAVVYLILFVVAAGCFAASTWLHRLTPPLALLALGLFAWVLVDLILQAKRV